MKIRAEQMSRLSEDVRSRFETRLIAHLETAYPEEVWDVPAEQLQSRVHQTVDRALSYGIRIEKDVAAFVELTFDLGEHFDTDAQKSWARDVLLNDRLSGAEKVAKLKQTLLLR